MKNKIIYWTSTSLVSLVMLYSAYGYMTNEQLKGAFVHLGFPDYFRIELAAAKIIGVIFLMIPAIPVKLKEFAYFGFAITFVSAFIAHTFSGDPASAKAAPIIFSILLAVSYFYFLKLKSQNKQHTIQIN
ncbi:DoxX family protein [Flavobacterium sp. F52]|uniref:DoxX family protein n=1 Tax=Flavobacterium sp. F52 TaxID=1202532 RepID=UPI000272D86F|nr:DoxX family protein [Flavobacterium sp. F52]EJG03182.1 hypothetical protein FF52_03280 [Flavobacterium sp. F52]